MDKLSRALFRLAAVSLIAALILAPTGFALAQDANDGDANTEDLSAQPKMMVRDIAGCWQGNAFNDSQGNTSIMFFFQQKKNKIIVKQSLLALESAVPVSGHIKGTVKATSFIFHGKVGNGCNIQGMGFFQNDMSLLGNYRYSGVCFEHQFTGGEFSKVTFLGSSCP